MHTKILDKYQVNTLSLPLCLSVLDNNECRLLKHAKYRKGCCYKIYPIYLICQMQSWAQALTFTKPSFNATQVEADGALKYLKTTIHSASLN